MLEIGLGAVILVVLVLPLVLHFVEQNLEVFLLLMGIVTLTVSHFFGTEPAWTSKIVKEAFTEPIMISAAVLFFGLAVYKFRNGLERSILSFEDTVSRPVFIFLTILVLGLLSSVITAIMAAILLVEIISTMKYDKEYELKIIVLGCFSIGLGAALTPIGEPLSTILVSKLRGYPYHATFLFPMYMLGIYIAPGIVALSFAGMLLKPSSKAELSVGLTETKKDDIKEIIIRAVKVYVFIIALVFLGEGFKPVIDQYIVGIPNAMLFWINMISAVLDNATLTAAQISPKMNPLQIKYILMGLLVSGGMLIPGNIPNIIAAGRLGIKSRDWARIGIPIGLVLMVVYFFIFEVLH